MWPDLPGPDADSAEWYRHFRRIQWEQWKLGTLDGKPWTIDTSREIELIPDHETIICVEFAYHPAGGIVADKIRQARKLELVSGHVIHSDYSWRPVKNRIRTSGLNGVRFFLTEMQVWPFDTEEFFDSESPIDPPLDGIDRSFRIDR